MKMLRTLSIFVWSLLVLQSCTKTESDFDEARPETITISASTLNISAGGMVAFTVLSSNNSNNVTADSRIFVNGAPISGNNFTFLMEGTFVVHAVKGSITSNVLTMVVAPAPSTRAYKHKVLVEEYSGTWCGNCPRILYGVDLLLGQTDKAIVVSTHLFNNDPFINSDGNNLAAQQAVSAVPTGHINRTTTWTGPQYENVPQVINAIQASSPTGIALRTAINNNNISVTVNTAFSQPLMGAKLTVYLVEDKLYATQRNYSSNLYSGQSSIQNFEFNGVLRDVVSALGGDGIVASGNSFEKSYSFAVPSGISNIANTKIVAFVTNSNGTVVNVQEVKVGQDKMFEIL